MKVEGISGFALVIGLFLCAPLFAWSDADTPAGTPVARVDLMSREGVAAVHGEWRYSDARLAETTFRSPGPDGQPSDKQNRTNIVEPQAGWSSFDDSAWEILDPATLDQRRSTGFACFNWYRLRLEIPERVGDIDVRGTTVVFETSLDDYAEVWVNGELSRYAGQSGGSVVKGWNASNRLTLARAVRPGQTFQLAVFGINGPISAGPTNYIWMRKASLEFFRDGEARPYPVPVSEVNIEVVRLDPEIDHIISLNPKLYKLSEGFDFTEGPLWMSAGYLLFSDPNRNRIYRYDPEGSLTVFREKSGYSGDDVGRFTQPGSNGLAVDSQGRVTVAEHGNRRISRIEPDGGVTVLAEGYLGKRLNSPNDLVYASDGSLYFTDPPFGLPGFYDDPGRQLSFSGIFRWKDGEVQLLSTDLKGPNGLAFSPDESCLYVGNWDPQAKVVMKYPVEPDGTLGPGRVFFDMTSAPGEEAIDGLKVDRQGRLFVSGPGGLWILSADGRHLGTVRTPQQPANFAWGREGEELYLTARTALYRLPLLANGN